MSRRVMLRLVLSCALPGAVLAACAGCGDTKPSSSKSNEKQSDDRTNQKGESSGAITQPPRKIDLDSGAGQQAVAFLKALGEGAAHSDRLSAGFVRAVGLPAELPSDKAKGYSTLSAESWLKRVGAGATFGLPAGFAGPDAAVLWGGFQGQGRKGDYFLRMANVSGAWKVDYFAMTSASSMPPAGAGASPDAEYQRFAARAMGGLLCDRDAMPKDERALALAASMTPALRAKLAEPFGSDKDQGFDFNRGKLLLEAENLGGGAESYSITPQSAPTDFRLDIAKTGGSKAACLLKLVKGPAPGQWLVESITPQ